MSLYCGLFLESSLLPWQIKYLWLDYFHNIFSQSIFNMAYKFIGRVSNRLNALIFVAYIRERIEMFSMTEFV